MKKISDFLTRIINGLLFLTIVMLIAITFLQVLARFVLHIPIVWTEEVVRISFVWLIFLGGAAAVKEGMHLTLDMFVSSLGRKWQFVFRMTVLLLMLLVSVIILFAGSSYFIRNIGKTVVTIQLPANFLFISAPVSAALMIFFTIEQIIFQSRAYFRKGNSQP